MSAAACAVLGQWVRPLACVVACKVSDLERCVHGVHTHAHNCGVLAVAERHPWRLQQEDFILCKSTAQGRASQLKRRVQHVDTT